jgi:site-specific DNA-methyltransferase (adenine-specific)
VEIGNGTFLHGDCLELMRDLPSGSVDMVLCDLPYGTTACSWDSVIPFEPLWEQYWRVCKPNAAVVLFGAEPFSTALRASQLGKFKYDWIWRKSTPGGFAQAKNMPLKQHEIVSVFSEGVSTHASQSANRITYNPQGLVYAPKVARNKPRHDEESAFGNRPSHKDEYVQEFTGYPNSVLEFKVERGIHPTQKPVALFEYLIRTYTNPGEIVLDNTAGSGTTAIAAENAGRRWVCMERDPTYYESAVGRVYEHVAA